MAASTTTSVPVPNQPLVDGQGMCTQAWRQFFVTLWTRTGGSAGGGIPGNITPGSSALSLPQARNDTQASAAGVPRWGFYMNGSVLQIQKDFP